MSIRHSLLAILDEGDCYGYQLRVEFERRTGGSRPLNVGQVYATLDRLERDGFVVKRGANATGHVYYAITATGRVEAAEWWALPDSGTGLPELALKVALAQSLPGVDAYTLVSRQRASTAVELETLRTSDAPTELSERLMLDARVESAQAELEWLARAEASLQGAASFGLDADPPRRGRPVRG